MTSSQCQSTENCGSPENLIEAIRIVRLLAPNIFSLAGNCWKVTFGDIPEAKKGVAKMPIKFCIENNWYILKKKETFEE